MDTKTDMNEWKEIKEQPKNKYPQLTGIELVSECTSKNDLTEMLLPKLGQTPKDLMVEIDSFVYSI